MKKCLRLLFLFITICFTLVANAQVSVTATAGTTGPSPYTTLKGAFDAVNGGIHQGVITITITANTTETATASLNASGSGSASYTSVLIRPGTGATPTITGNISSAPVVKFNGANNVILDGSNNGTTTRDLTITNTSVTSSNVLVIGSVGTTPINNVTAKNTILINGTNTSTAVLITDAAVVGNPGYFTNITLQNNSIQKAYIGIYIYCVVTAAVNNVVVTGNDLNTPGTNAIRLVGIYLQGVNGATISNNNLGNFDGASPEFDRVIWFATATKNSTISGNIISNMAYTGTSSYGPIGINVSPGITNANINVTGNTVTNLTSSGTGTTMGIFSYSAASGISYSNNRINNIKNTNTSGYGAAGIVLTHTITSAATRVFNNFIWDVASYGFNDYGSADNGNGIAVDGGGGYDIDFNTIVLNTNQTLTGGHKASCLLITANVTATAAINLRNNIFTNLQTIGNANSRLAISNLATTGSAVFGTNNYNNYYSTSGNLSSTGTTASITTTIAGLQTSLGGNANSTNIQPVFVSANDIHLDPNVNTTLSNTGTTLAGITTDIDGDTRAATPDMGADEFALCVPINFTEQPVNATICLGSDTSFKVTTSNGTAYQWQVNTGSGFTNISDGSVYGGTGTATLTLTNPPASYSTYIYRARVTGAQAACFNNSATATLTINPIPNAVATPSSQTACSGPITTIVLNGAVAGTSYNWTRDHTADVTGIGASGTGNISGSLTNTTAGPVTVTFTITPIANGCPGTPITATVALTASASITCPANIVVGNATGTCGATVTYTPTTVGLPAGSLTYTFTGATTGTGSGDGSGSVFSIGTTTVTIDGTGSCGSANCSFTVTVNDTQNPVITCPAGVTVSCASAVPATDITAVTASDNCPGVVVTHVGDVISNQTCANRYTITRTYRATDAAGNIANCTQIINVNDQTAPVITCPANITVATPASSCTAVVNFTPTATDNCAGTVTVTSSPASGFAFPIGTTTVTSTATDACGNTSTCTFTVTVTDSQLPNITLQPVNDTVCAGGTATFVVAAAPAQSYQWQVNTGSGFTNINGATTFTLTIPNVTLSMHNYQYRVIVQGACSQKISDPATLKVNDTPTVSITAAPLTSLLPGQVTTLYANFNHTPGSFAWYVNGNLYQTTTAPLLPNVDVDHLGNYHVVYTDNTGCSATSNTVGLQANIGFQFWVYPVPNDGHFMVRFYSYAQGVKRTLRVWDSKGGLVFNKEFTMNSPYERMDVDISKYSAGTYHLVLTDASGKTIGTSKIVVLK